MWWRRRFALALGFGCLLACGESEGPEVPSDGPAGSGGTAGMGGGGAGGTGAAATSGSGGSAAECQGQLDFAERTGADGTCGGVSCPALPDNRDPRFDYRRHCCTDSGACGVGSGAYFGGACFERDQAGTPSGDCPDGSVLLYFDLGSEVAVVDGFRGCCRPDGQCGLDTSATFGAGCVERSELADALADTCNGLDPIELFDSIACVP